ncbi:MAG: prolyl oligopeptidase family serine peptidase [Planctomycetaceae bacterium]|nr:prolyl oligopeptidase family serine peptidase [Planctomycetaceae bacterium]
MKHICRFLCTLCALSVLLADTINADPLPQEQIESIAIQPATNWGRTDGIVNVVPEMLSLFKEKTLEIDGKTMKYRLHVPENMESGKKYPLILWLHGIGEVGTDNKLQLVHLHHILPLLTGERKRDFFLLVPQHSSNEHWASACRSMSVSYDIIVPDEIKDDAEGLEKHKETLIEQIQAATPSAEVMVQERWETATFQRRVGGMLGIGGMVVDVSEQVLMLHITVHSGETDTGHPLERAFAMVEQVVDHYPVDENRITVSGLSSGGDGTWRALERRPDLFAAAVPLVSWTALSDVYLEKHPILKKVPIWAIYSSDDRSIDYARTEFERNEKAGANVKKTEFGICGHHAWTPAMLQADIFSWLLSRAKDGDRYYAVFDPGVDPDDMRGIVEVATRDTRPAPTLAPTRPAPPALFSPFATMPLRPENTIDARDAADASGVVHFTPEVQVQDPLSHQRSRAYIAIARAYYSAGILFLVKENQEKAAEVLANFERTANKIPVGFRMALLAELAEHGLPHQNIVPVLEVLERLLDEAAGESRSFEIRRAPPLDYDTVSANVQERLQMNAASTAISAARIIEECDRPWAMTSESIYGMFAADWDKEAEAIPDFIVNLTSEQLSHQLARSFSEDPESKDFIAACRSILLLQHRPMSSPWFETSGGRLRSEIQYELSQKGQMFVRFLRVVQDSADRSDKARELAKVAERTLEKINLVLAKD